MPAESALLRAELESLGLHPEVMVSDRRGMEMIRLELVKGLPCLLHIAEPSRELFNFVSTVSLPVTIGDHLPDLERMMSQLDDLLAPARIFAFDREIGISVHGSWSTAEGLQRLSLESILLHRRLAEYVLAPLLDFILDKTSAEQSLTTIITGLAATNPVLVAASEQGAHADGKLRP